MPFEKTYSQRLRTFPPELRDSSIQYRELKKLIGCLVDELNDLGLSPEILRQVISRVESGGQKSFSHIGLPDLTLANRSDEKRFSVGSASEVPLRGAPYSKVLYEVISESGKSFPQLRVYKTAGSLSEKKSGTPSGTNDRNSTKSARCKADELLPSAARRLSAPHPKIELGDREHHGRESESTSIPNAPAVLAVPAEKSMREIVIPLVHDAQFFDLFEDNVQTLTLQMEKMHSEFLESLSNLTRMITETCQPASATGSYHPYSSVSTHPGTVEVKVKHMKSDLYAWREIFGLYVDSDLFEHSIDGSKVEWSIEESEKRLSAFADKVSKRWLNDKTCSLPRRKGRDDPKETTKKFKCRRSAEALQIFIKLNFLVLDIRKVFQANIEAIQKLVKKHTEHTALPLSCSFSINANMFSIGHLYQSSCTPLPGLIHPRLFIQEMAEKLFPIVPSQDDYLCAICTNIAFKPIRLNCTHLFCVRCLVKLQKRGEGNCPMCRAPSVLGANARNVDWGLLNFMEDWFPRESREKLKANEREVVSEQLTEWRRNEADCVII